MRPQIDPEGTMEFRMNEGLEILSTTPTVLSAMLAGKSAGWLSARTTHEAFNPGDVIGHLIHAEHTDWIPRARIILECGDARTFDPFDRFDFQSLIEGKSIDELLREFADARRQSLDALRSFNLGEEQFALLGRHPEFGPVTLGNLLATWCVHDLAHTAQVARTMASAYRDAVGPWLAYTSILK
jgi:hypothetical protein